MHAGTYSAHEPHLAWEKNCLCVCWSLSSNKHLRAVKVSLCSEIWLEEEVQSFHWQGGVFIVCCTERTQAECKAQPPHIWNPRKPTAGSWNCHFLLLSLFLLNFSKSQSETVWEMNSNYVTRPSGRTSYWQIREFPPSAGFGSRRLPPNEGSVLF